MHIVRGLPREPHDDEPVSLDLEIYKMNETRLHRPSGTFAALSVAFHDAVYQITDVHDVPKVLGILAPGLWIMHNATFDLAHLRRWSSVPQRKVWDTMIVEQDLFGGYYDTFALDDLSRRWLGKMLPKEEREQFAGRSDMTAAMEQYAADDASATLAIYEKQKQHMADEGEDLRCYWEIDEPAIWAVLDMPGVKVNVDGWRAMAVEHATKAQTIADVLGFNPGSYPQTKKTIKGVLGQAPRDTKALTLQTLMLGSEGKAKELLASVLEYRMYKKASSTYGERWLEENVEEGDLVYSGWRVTGAETGRMSARSPNLMQIPARRIPKFREMFLPRYRRMIVADVKQQEPRIAAWWSKDEVLLETIRRGESVYLPVKEATGLDDFGAKTIFLGSLYGLSDYGLASRLHCTKEEAAVLLRKLLGRFKRVAIWQYRTKSQAYQRSYVLTPSGRKVWLNLYNKQWEKSAVNSPIQGGAADQTKIALGYLHTMGVLPCLVVHDELVVDSDNPKHDARIVREAWIEAGKKVIPGVPVEVEVLIGRNWGVKAMKESAEDFMEETDDNTTEAI